ncbi:MAG: RDD family protein [Candidatus Promineifilaceae bacterium]|jgi:uncharacterized RDD family membrane protein YckC
MEQVENARFGTRLIAWLIDMAALAILSFVLTLLFAGVVTIGESTDSTILGFLTSASAFLLAAINLVLQFLYFGWLWSRNGQSFGMIAMKIRVNRPDGHTLASFWRAGLRGSVGYWISGLIFGIGYLWALIDANNQAWHDKIFDTRVVIPSPYEVNK